MEKKDKSGINILVCGSSHTEDPAFVGMALRDIYKMFNGEISKIVTSDVPGVCEQAKCWVEVMNEGLPEDKKIGIDYFNYAGFKDPKNSALYEHLEIPDFALKNHPFYTKGTQELLEKNVHMVLAFPNKDGELGASTKNIQRFCTLTENKIKFIDISEFTQMILEKAKTLEASQPTQNNSGFTNRHNPKRK